MPFPKRLLAITLVSGCCCGTSQSSTTSSTSASDSGCAPSSGSGCGDPYPPCSPVPGGCGFGETGCGGKATCANDLVCAEGQLGGTRCLPPGGCVYDVDCAVGQRCQPITGEMSGTCVGKGGHGGAAGHGGSGGHAGHGAAAGAKSDGSPAVALAPCRVEDDGTCTQRGSAAEACCPIVGFVYSQTGACIVGANAAPTTLLCVRLPPDGRSPDGCVHVAMAECYSRSTPTGETDVMLAIDAPPEVALASVDVETCSNAAFSAPPCEGGIGTGGHAGAGGSSGAGGATQGGGAGSGGAQGGAAASGGAGAG